MIGTSSLEGKKEIAEAWTGRESALRPEAVDQGRGHDSMPLLSPSPATFQLRDTTEWSICGAAPQSRQWGAVAWKADTCITPQSKLCI